MNWESYETRFFVEEQDLQRIKDIGKVIKPEIYGIITGYMEWLRTIPEVAPFLDKPDFEKKSRKMHTAHWNEFFAGELSKEYVTRRIELGQTRARGGMSLDIYYTSVSVFNQLFEKAFKKLGLNDFDLLSSFHKLVSLNTAIIVDACNAVNNEQLQNKDQALAQLGTPVSKLWDGILLIPLVGEIDEKRAQDILSTTLNEISESQAKVCILDISGIIDAQGATAVGLIKLTKATKLMGCDCLISGMSPTIVQKILDLGVEVEAIRSVGTMKAAIEKALGIVGLRLHTVIE